MRNPHPENFNPKVRKRQPDAIDMTGIVAIEPKPQPLTPKTDYPASPAGAFRNTAARLPESGQVGSKAGGQAQLPESPIARKTESLLARNLAACVRAALETKAAKKESFRFPEELMTVLEDLPYEIKKTHGKRITKTAVFVAAFAAYLWEFKHKGQDSLLYKHLIEAENA
ncbi:MAG: hypothetical protein ABI690_29600 [Chloroflexota bacterium]